MTNMIGTRAGAKFKEGVVNRMGEYVNPTNVSFKEAVNSVIYVDKSELIAYTNSVMKTTHKYICVSRPRRFGKSMVADMLAAYYSKGCDSDGLFAGRKIGQSDSFRAHLNQHHVIRFDVQQFLFDESHRDIFIEQIQAAIIAELRDEFGDCFHEGPYGLPGVLKQIYNQRQQGFIFIIDEWDCVFRLAKEHKGIQKRYLDFLRGLFKGPEYVELAYMTGILPIKKYGEHSALNIFEEFSMIDSVGLSRYFGFTQAEVVGLCDQYGVDFVELQTWYDGYVLDGLHIYNPKSVVDVMRRGRFKSYWAGTESYYEESPRQLSGKSEALKVYIEQNFDGLREVVAMLLGNGRCKVDPTTFQNDMTSFKTKDDVLTLLIHLGYLGYDDEKGEVFIPNQEIVQEYMRAIKVGGWDGLIKALKYSEELLRHTWALDGDAVAKGIAAIHNETTSILKYNDENSLACALCVAYYSAKAYYAFPIYELPSGKGFADVVYLPLRNVDRPALVVELKWDKSAQGAIAQILKKQYADWVESFIGDILLVGINYDKDTKEHQCVIARHTKV